MNETNRTYPKLVAKIQVYMSNKTQNSNSVSLLRKSGSYKKCLTYGNSILDKSAKAQMLPQNSQSGDKINMVNIVFLYIIVASIIKTISQNYIWQS